MNSNEHSKTMTRLEILNESVKFLSEFKLNPCCLINNVEKTINRLIFDYRLDLYIFINPTSRIDRIEVI